MPFWNDPLCSRVRYAPASPAKIAAQDDVPVAQLDDVDADRLGRLRDARRRPASAGPSATGRARPGGTMTRKRTEIAIGPWAKNPLMIQPTSGRSTRNAGRLDGVEDAGAEARVRRDDQAVEVGGQAEGQDVDDRPADDLVGPDRDREPGVEERRRASPVAIAATTPSRIGTLRRRTATGRSVPWPGRQARRPGMP